MHQADLQVNMKQDGFSKLRHFAQWIFMPLLPGMYGFMQSIDIEIQIDIVGTPVEGNEYLIGSCKYRNEKIGIGELELIRRYASVFRKNGTFHYYIFSRGGFTQELIMAAEKGEVTLLTLEDLYAG